MTSEAFSSFWVLGFFTFPHSSFKAVEQERQTKKMQINPK